MVLLEVKSFSNTHLYHPLFKKEFLFRRSPLVLVLAEGKGSSNTHKKVWKSLPLFFLDSLKLTLLWQWRPSGT